MSKHFQRMNRIKLVIIITLLFQFAPAQSQVPELPVYDNHTYFGYEYGAAGISLGLLEYVEQSEDKVLNSLILESVNKSLSTIWDNQLEIEGEILPTWPKYPGLITIYPGNKYGSSGMIPTFLKYAEITGESLWVDRAISTFEELMDEAYYKDGLPSWSYSYSTKGEEGVPITDIKFGSAGILKTAMEMFNVTKNTEYLDIGELIVGWLKSVTFEETIGSETYNILPWFDLPSYDTVTYTGYNWGLAGIMVLLHQFGNLNNDQSLIDWGNELGDFLKAGQNKEGSWDQDFYIDGDSHGFDIGTCGVIYGLRELEMLNSNQKYKDTIDQALNHLYKYFIHNDTVIGFFTDDSRNRIDLSLHDGLLGILKTLVKVYDYLTADEKITVKNGYEWLLSKGSAVITREGKKLLHIFSEYNGDRVVDFSYATGMTGLLSELLIIKENDDILLDIPLDDALISIVNTLLYYQLENGLWEKQKIIPSYIPTEQFTSISQSTVIPDIEETPISWVFIPALMIPILIRNKKS